MSNRRGSSAQVRLVDILPTLNLKVSIKPHDKLALLRRRCVDVPWGCADVNVDWSYYRIKVKKAWRPIELTLASSVKKSAISATKLSTQKILVPARCERAQHMELSDELMPALGHHTRDVLHVEGKSLRVDDLRTDSDDLALDYYIAGTYLQVSDGGRHTAQATRTATHSIIRAACAKIHYALSSRARSIAPREHSFLLLNLCLPAAP